MEQRHLTITAASDVADPTITPEQVMLLGPAVGQAIASMYARYSEQVTLSKIAAEVFVSPFHFSRVFTKATGVTPGRYLTAIRLFEAKKLLLGTDLTVSDIVCSVGYSSVGTFTSRFTRAVGMTPTQYRAPEVRQLLVAMAPHYQRLPSSAALRDAEYGYASGTSGMGTITGRIELLSDWGLANVLVGVFSEPVPQCSPVAFTCWTNTTSAADFEIHGVPSGQWTVIAIAEHAPGTVRSTFSFGTTSCGIDAGTTVQHVGIHMRSPRPTDPPIAITLATPTSPIGHRALRRRLGSVA